MPIRHLRSILVSLTASSLCTLPSTAGAARPVAEFESVGKVCLSKAQQAIVLKKLSSAERGAVTLVGYSDAHEMRAKPRLENCLTRKIPEPIRGHERIAVARALHVYEIAHRAGIPGFDAPPVVHVSLDDHVASEDPSTVAIVAKRAITGDDYARRVDLITTRSEPPRPADAAAVQQIVIEGPRVELDEVAQEFAHSRALTPKLLRVFAWAELGVGAALTTLGGAFLISGAIQHRAAADTIDPERGMLLEADGYHYVRAGGWAAAVGGGLILGGIVSLAIASRLNRGVPARAEHGRYGKRRATVGLGSKGVMVRW